MTTMVAGIVSNNKYGKRRRNGTTSSLVSMGWICLCLVLHLAQQQLNNAAVFVMADKVNLDDDEFGEWLYEPSLVRGVSKVMDIAWLPNDDGVDALVTSKMGDIWLFKDGDMEQDNNRKKKVLELKPCVNTEMALQSIAVHPKFGTKDKDGKKSHDYVYVYWNAPGKNGDCTPIEMSGSKRPFDDENIDMDGPYNRLSRFSYDSSKEQLVKEEVLLKTGIANKMHNGGGMAFGNDGKLWLSIGDAGYPREYDPSNNLDNLWGSVLRLNDDGTVPNDNPYVNEPNAQPCGTKITNPGNGEKRVCSEIFARGLRNPFALEMNPNTPSDKVEFHVSDVGRSSWEEVSVGGTGYEKVNYGWREREGPCEMGQTDSDRCDTVDPDVFQDPLYFLEHPPELGCAIVGGAFVPNGAWPSEFDNQYLYSELRGRGIFHLKYDPDNECRGTKCKKQLSKYVPIPIVEDIENARGSLRLKFGPYSKNGRADKEQISLYHIQYDGGEINRLTYIQHKERPKKIIEDSGLSDNNHDIENEVNMNTNANTNVDETSVEADVSDTPTLIVENEKPIAIVKTMYSSNHEGVTVHFDGSDSTDPNQNDDLTYKWDFGDDAQGGIYNVLIGGDGKASYTYKTPGLYVATLTVNDQEGLESSKEYVDITVDDDFMRPSDIEYGTESLKNFVWNDDCEGDEIDYCGVLDFCYDEITDAYGYHQRQEYGNSGFYSKCEASVKRGNSPVLRMNAGKTYRLTVLNLSRLPTNIHTHGLHVVGSGSGDDVTRIIQSENCIDYVYDLRSDHPGGTYWYHPHAHAYSEQQVNGGATGMLIIEDSVENSGDGIPYWASNELLLQVLRLDDGQLMYSNGRSYEIFDVTPGKWYRLRVSTVDPIGVSQHLRFTEGCEIHKVASDGVWHSVVPFDNEDLNEKAKSGIFPMTGSSRADFAIRCDARDPNTNFINVFYGDKLSAIVNIKTTGSASNLRNELGKWTPKRPLSIRSMIEEDVPDKNKFSIHISRDSINEMWWDKDTPLKQIAYDEVHEWQLPNTVGHPFHAHLYHMQIVEEGGCGDGYNFGEFYDTICTDQPCKVRFRSADFGQRLVVHCHTMLHSDLGSMAWFDVQGEGMPLYETALPNYDCKSDIPPSIKDVLPSLPLVPKVPVSLKDPVDDEPPRKPSNDMPDHFGNRRYPPFTLGALDYDEAFKKKIPEGEEKASNPRCMETNEVEKNHDGDGVLSLRKGDETCRVRDDSPCVTAHWVAGEFASYRFTVPKYGEYDIRVRVATSEQPKGRPLRAVELNLLTRIDDLTDSTRLGHRIGRLDEDEDAVTIVDIDDQQHDHIVRKVVDSELFFASGLGWSEYEDLVWRSVSLSPNDYTLQILQKTGLINICSVAIYEVSE